jgi:hypothetical protein
VFLGYCDELGIQICYASIAHPESNGQVKRANDEILEGLKTRTYDCLKKHGANWTSSSRATGETPFFLVYGAEVVIPLEITMVSPCVQTYNEATQDQL